MSDVTEVLLDHQSAFVVLPGFASAVCRWAKLYSSSNMSVEQAGTCPAFHGIGNMVNLERIIRHRWCRPTSVMME